MSTNHPKTGLLAILSYGKEALTNRFKDLFLISFLFLGLPHAIAMISWVQASNSSIATLPSLAALPPLALVEAMFAIISSTVFIPILLALVAGSIGILALARTCVDYFESRPGTFRSIVSRSARVFLTKSFGVILLLVIVSPMLSVLPMLRAVALSLLLMLPVTLVTTATGGFKTTWDTLTLKYSLQTRLGRWPVFINVLSINGLFLSLFFGISIAIESIATFDVIFEMPAGIFEKTINMGGLSYNTGAAITDLLGLLWMTTAFAVIMPFTAAIYHFATLPRDHIAFETHV